MKKRLYRALIALTMTTILFCVSACGRTTDATSEETLPETEEEFVEESEEIEAVEEEMEDTDNVVTDGEYTIYPAFIKTFELNDNVLKVETGDAFKDYEIPTEMSINFECPLATDVAWTDNVTKVTEEDDWYGWFSFSLEGITKAAQRYNDGQYEGTYTSGEDFCEKNAVWTFIIKDETVQSISMDLVESEATEETTDAKSETTTEANNDAKETNASTTGPSAKEDKTASNPAPTAPVHTHSYSSSVTKQPTCGSNGVKTYTCSCGDSYTESISGGDHNWNPIYSTVEHPSMGEMRQVQVGTSGDVYICKTCNAEFGSSSEHVNHCASYVGIDNNHAVSTYFIRDGGPVYENQWVVTQEAWTETVVAGYQCSICGATK